jgi:uncharacterized membrane protein
MRSKARLGNQPIHPMVVPIPVGALTVVLVSDLVTLGGGAAGWATTARYALWVGIAGALLAAVFGFIDFFGVKMSMAGYRLARIHMVLNLVAVVLYAGSAWLRGGEGDTPQSAIALACLGFLLFCVSGWLGGKMVYEHKIAVVENADPEATELGRREPA